MHCLDGCNPSVKNILVVQDLFILNILVHFIETVILIKIYNLYRHSKLIRGYSIWPNEYYLFTVCMYTFYWGRGQCIMVLKFSFVGNRNKKNKDLITVKRQSFIYIPPTSLKIEIP